MSVFRLKDYRLGDTIAAIATFPGKSALGVIKVSGPKALAIAAKLFKPRKSKDIRKVKTHTLHYGWIVEKKDKGKSPACRLRPRRDPAESAKGGCMRETRHEVIDEVLLSVMRKPSTYTKEDIVEISSHGGAAVLNKILNLLLQQGARLALPGEFTYRALIGGRIDLLQAESIRGIVDARSEDALTFASSQLRGDTTFKLKRLKQELKELFVLTESMINFPEEEPDSVSCNWEKKIEDLAKRIDGLLKGSREAEIICEGLKCVICGKANAGKSTLFNRLLKEERVIVSRIPGTTRDIIEETISIRGIPLRIYDTAGIIEPEDLVARRALKKSLKIFSECDLVIFVFDGSRPLEKEDLFLLQRVNNKNVIFVINKSDLVQRLNFRKMPQIKGEIVKMSTLKNKGLEKLEDAVFRKVYLQGIDRENVVFLSQYQRQILIRISSSLNRIKAFLDQKQPIDFINIELKECLDNLGRISGEVFSEEILKSIFSNFCIGK